MYNKSGFILKFMLPQQSINLNIPPYSLEYRWIFLSIYLRLSPPAFLGWDKKSQKRRKKNLAEWKKVFNVGKNEIRQVDYLGKV